MILIYILAVLVLLDLLYIYNTKTYYLKMINNIQKKEANVRKGSFVLIYIILAFALYFFIIKVKKSKEDAFILGSAIYAIYDLTNYTIFDNWDTTLMLIDIFWGGILYYSTTYIIYRLIEIKKI